MSLSKPTNPITLLLDSLATGRQGITPHFGGCLAEAASVCLSDQGHSCPKDMDISGKYSFSAELNWTPPSSQARHCWNDDQVATEHGAYGVASLLVEECGLEVIERSKKKTGFDYWLGPKDDPDPLFQKKCRLEVSGIRNGDSGKVTTRVKQKKEQTTVSDNMSIPAVIVVVEFGTPLARMVER